MNVGIVGLGLIGGSMAKAYAKAHRVFGYDKDKETLSYAKLSETIEEELTDDNIGACDLVVLALYPEDTVAFLKEKAPLIQKDVLVLDTCGTKRMVCDAGFAVAKEHGFTFVGAHPMAGVQFSGIKFSRADMFRDASMIIVPPTFDDIALLTRVKDALAPLKLGKITVSTAEHHDQMIAYTSQLAHIVSSAYIKSETAKEHQGYSAGSYRDMTRVATLNEKMWTELFLENRENLLYEVESLIGALSDFRDALKEDDREKLFALLKEGTECKKRADG